MYVSQSMITLVLLLLLTGALFYNTIDIQKKQVIEEMRASSVDLKSSSVDHVVSSSLSPIFNKVLNDASLKVAKEGFFNNPDEVVDYLKNNSENNVRDYLNNISNYYSNQGYNFTYSFNIINITMVDGFTFKINYNFNYTLSHNGTINKTENINSFQYVTVKTILDAYHYLKPIYIMPINISNPNNYDLTDFQVKIILNNSNFDFSKDPNGTGLRFVDKESNHIPYWIEYWNYTDDSTNNNRAIIWIKVPILEANQNTTIYLVSTYPKIPESNGDEVFELFDDFEYNNSIDTKWNDLYGDWDYNITNNLLYNPIYNRQIIGCEDAPPVARIISLNDISLENYTIEVIAKGENNYNIPNSGIPYPAPNIMVGYFADPQNGSNTLHPDAFYTFDLGGKCRWWGVNVNTLNTISDNIYWSESLNGVVTLSTIMICKEYPHSYDYINRDLLLYYSTQQPEKGTWYHIKILIRGNKVYGTYTPLNDYINNNENPGMISTTINIPYGSYFELGTSWGDHNNSQYQNVYFDNFRIRKYAPKEPEVYVSGNVKRTYPLIYISPSRSYGTHYGEGGSYNPYFIEDTSGECPSIVDMLAGKDTKEWEYGYGIRVIDFIPTED
ncbi:DUF2341 domain-containing protein [Methanothermococcus sp. SCGC AD-155-C09]|nr:DUF2341 domain-containing protein [Methanothermococcus sp. SCGC AD-155-C09]